MHLNKINNKVYIGQTVQSPPQKRWYPSNYKHNEYFYNAIQKYGWDNFEHIIIEEVCSLEEANQREQYWINYYNSINREYGYNIRPGGNNSLLSEETKKKMSQNHRDVSGEKNYFYGKHFCGEQHPMYGKHHSEETKQKISQSKLNKNGKPVRCITTNKIFNTIREAGRYYNISSSHIAECCKGKRKTCGKYNNIPLTWEYFIDELEDK
jgi:group I intron endonuclease